MHPNTFSPWRRRPMAARCVKTLALGALAMIAAWSQAAELTEAELVRQLSARPAAGADDPDAGFVSRGLSSKNLRMVRAPDTDGACSPGEAARADQKSLVVVPIALVGAPQAILPLQFEFGSYRLTPADQRQLRVLARAVNGVELHDGRFTIAGHTDAVGDESINRKLSCARALAARTYLVEFGVTAERISAYGFGSSRPLVNSGLAQAENRRVEIRRADD